MEWFRRCQIYCFSLEGRRHTNLKVIGIRQKIPFYIWRKWIWKMKSGNPQWKLLNTWKKQCEILGRDVERNSKIVSVLMEICCPEVHQKSSAPRDLSEVRSSAKTSEQRIPQQRLASSEIGQYIINPYGNAELIFWKVQWRF